MHHYVAFLRGINLGNRRIKMEKLRALFEELRFANVETFIASGNVIFSSRSADSKKMEKQIQVHLKKSLGYAVDTFIRTREELAAVAAFRPFQASELDHPDHTVHVGFFNGILPREQARAFSSCRTDVDEFHVNGRDYYWLCRIKTHESKVWRVPALKAAKLPTSSMRNLTTIRKLATLYPALSG